MRQSAARVERTYRFEYMTETDASPELIHDLNALSAKWRGKAPERGFTMSLSQDVDGSNPEFRLCVALDEDGKPGGFLRIVPVYGDAPGLHARPHAPRPRHAQRHDRVPADPHAHAARRARATSGCR